MSVMQAKAKAVSDALIANHGLSKDIVGTGPFIGILIQLLSTLLPQLLGCLTPAPLPPPAPVPTPPAAADVHARLQNLQWYDVIYIYRETKTALMTPHAYRTMGNAIATEIIAAAKASTVDETTTAMLEVADQ